MKLTTATIAAVTALSASALGWAGYHFSTGRGPVISRAEASQPVAVNADLMALQELVSVLKTYTTAQSVEADFTTYLMDATGHTVLESFDGRYVKDSANLYIRSYGSESLVNRRYMIAVDHDEKMLFVERSDINQHNSLFHFGLLSDVDSLVNLPDSLVFYRQLDKHTAQLTVDIPSGNYYKTEYIYDIQTKQLQRLNLYPYSDVFDEDLPSAGEIGRDGIITTIAGGDANNGKESPFEGGRGMSVPANNQPQPGYISILYHHIHLNTVVDRTWFDESRYFTLQDQQPVPTNRYKTYEIDFE